MATSQTTRLDRELAAEQALLPRGVGDAYAAALYVPPPLEQPVGLPWHAERRSPERPCDRCGVASGQPCLVSRPR